jgi:hypothetical protein
MLPKTQQETHNLLSRQASLSMGRVGSQVTLLSSQVRLSFFVSLLSDKNRESGQILLGPSGTGLFIVHLTLPSISMVFRADWVVRCCETPKLDCIDP